MTAGKIVEVPPNNTFEEIGRLIEEHERFVVTSHVRPDGDAVGSAAALGFSLADHGKQVEIVNADGVPERLQFLPGWERVHTLDQVPEDFVPQVVFALDSADEKRIGKSVREWIGSDKIVVNIDHHVSNSGYGDYRYIDGNSPATGQIVYELVRALDLPLSADAMQHLWAAISTDTGSFQYPSTTARTFEIASELIRGGVDVGKISQHLYESFPYRRIELLRALLNVLKISGEGRVASWVLTRETIDKLGIVPPDTEGLIDIIRAIQGVVVAVFFEEMKDGAYRVSCRSKDPAVDVSRICEKFGGGGHRLAAGTRVMGKQKRVEEKFLKAVYDGFEGKY